MTYFSEATPTDVLPFAAIGSRPAKRTGVGGLEDLRAIPWVFGWTQNRHMITGWYGFGSAIKQLSEQNGDAIDTLRQVSRTGHSGATWSTISK